MTLMVKYYESPLFFDSESSYIGLMLSIYSKINLPNIARDLAWLEDIRRALYTPPQVTRQPSYLPHGSSPQSDKTLEEKWRYAHTPDITANPPTILAHREVPFTKPQT